MLTIEQIEVIFPIPFGSTETDISFSQLNVLPDQVSRAWIDWINNIMARSDLDLETKWTAWKSPKWADWQNKTGPSNIYNWAGYANSDQFLTMARAGNPSGFGSVTPVNWHVIGYYNDGRPIMDYDYAYDFPPPPSNGFGETQFYYDLLANKVTSEPACGNMQLGPRPVWYRPNASDMAAALRWETRSGTLNTNPQGGNNPITPTNPPIGGNDSTTPPIGSGGTSQSITPLEGSGIALAVGAAALLLMGRKR